MAVVLLRPPPVYMKCVACDTEFRVESDADGRPMHDCPRAGGLSLPLNAHTSAAFRVGELTHERF